MCARGSSCCVGANCTLHRHVLSTWPVPVQRKILRCDGVVDVQVYSSSPTQRAARVTFAGAQEVRSVCVCVVLCGCCKHGTVEPCCHVTFLASPLSLRCFPFPPPPTPPRPPRWLLSRHGKHASGPMPNLMRVVMPPMPPLPPSHLVPLGDRPCHLPRLVPLLVQLLVPLGVEGRLHRPRHRRRRRRPVCQPLGRACPRPPLPRSHVVPPRPPLPRSHLVAPRPPLPCLVQLLVHRPVSQPLTRACPRSRPPVPPRPPLVPLLPHRPRQPGPSPPAVPGPHRRPARPCGTP